jgi:hypothetical protein
MCEITAAWPHEPALGPLGFDFAQHRRTPRPSVERIRRKALLPFGALDTNLDTGVHVPCCLVNKRCFPLCFERIRCALPRVRPFLNP